MRFRCHFTLGRYLNAPSQAQATPSHPGNGAPRSKDRPTVASSGHMMASAGWARATPRFGMINGASQWRTFFEGFDDRIAVMTLPHHGSANNFHPEILGFRALRFALATTVEARNPVSRLRETLGAIEQAGIHARVIDDGRLSTAGSTFQKPARSLPARRSTRRTWRRRRPLVNICESDVISVA